MELLLYLPSCFSLKHHWQLKLITIVIYSIHDFLAIISEVFAFLI